MTDDGDETPVELISLLRKTASYEFDAYSSPRAMLKDVELGAVASVQDLSEGVVADETGGRGVLLVTLQIDNFWKGKEYAPDSLVTLALPRPKNLGAEYYKDSWLSGSRLVVFATASSTSVKFLQRDPGRQTFEVVPQGLFIEVAPNELVSVWEDDEHSWPESFTFKELRAATL